MKKLRYIFGFNLIVFLITSIHLGYQYIVYSSEKVFSKGGTAIEGTSQPIIYLPYLSISQSDKRYQHLLFKGCITVGSGNQLTGDICTITTKDQKTYAISLNPGLKWSDNTPITINDVFFTYNEIIKNNQRGLPFLDSYSKLEITQNDDGTINITFPRESIDNQLFFLNPIIPAHHLTNKELSYYQTVFAANPITSTCARLKPQTTDKNSIIFDLTDCTDFTPQILQVKQFDTNTGLQSYISTNPKVIDYIINGSDNRYVTHEIPSSQSIIAYFHVNNIADTTRRQLALIFKNVISSPETQISGFISYQGLFNLPGSTDRNSIKLNLGLIKHSPTSEDLLSGTTASATGSKPQSAQNEIPILTKNVLAYGTNKYKTTYLPAQPEKFTISFKFDQAYDKVAISANGAHKYFPESYKPETKTAEYNLSTAFNNLNVGKNTYTVRGYKGDQAITLLTLTIYYINKPSTTTDQNSDNKNIITNLDGTRVIRIVYVDHPVIRSFINNLKTVLGWNKIGDNFIFSSVDSVADLEEVVSSKGYEVIIKPIDLGSRNDLSILVHEDPMINNAQYKNQTLKNHLSDLNQSSKKTQQKIITAIQDIYRKDVPFMILGNTVDYVHISPHVERVPNKLTSPTTIRNQLLNSIRPIYSLKINSTLLYDPSNLLRFLIGSNAH